MKRSTQVSLVVMTAAGIGAGAYALTPNDNCRRSPSSATAREPQDAVPTAREPQGTMPTAREPQGAMPTASAPDCRSSRGGSAGHGSSSFFSYGSGYSSYGSPGATTMVANRTSAATSASRGGFGSIGQGLASFAGS
jgi:hypothetical protein